ncbi:unnamed protein product [Lactuca saligna]|uniref:Uncharacterized protein n=1 Tax=Lactuca saligna TaxID=75948 RepID=A0AA36E407_LACSI|nr:unnamed protein product [Lactuca saligna]
MNSVPFSSLSSHRSIHCRLTPTLGLNPRIKSATLDSSSTTILDDPTSASASEEESPAKIQQRSALGLAEEENRMEAAGCGVCNWFPPPVIKAPILGCLVIEKGSNDSKIELDRLKWVFEGSSGSPYN